MLAGPRPDVAVLDLNLGGATSAGVAERLRDLGVSFIFATGYGDICMIPEKFREAPVVRKPYSAAALISAIGSARRR
jgi:FixJ family two-component response regulator